LACETSSGVKIANTAILQATSNKLIHKLTQLHSTRKQDEIKTNNTDATSTIGIGIDTSGSGGTIIPCLLDNNDINNKDNNDASSSLNYFAPTKNEYTFVVKNAVYNTANTSPTRYYKPAS